MVNIRFIKGERPVKRPFQCLKAVEVSYSFRDGWPIVGMRIGLAPSLPLNISVTPNPVARRASIR